MSIYLGNQKVGISYSTDNAANAIISEDTLIDLNDAVAYRIGDYNERTVSQMVEDLKANFFREHDFKIFPNYHKGPWVRPQEWPDLDSLNLQMSGDDDFIFMTYDNTYERSGMGLHIEKTSGGTDISVTMGHINNGTYVIDEVITGSSNNYVRWFTNSDPDYPVIRITGNIRDCYAYNISKDDYILQHRRQRILERIAYVPNIYRLGSNSNCWAPFSLVREKISNGTGIALTTLSYAWNYARDLEDLDISGLLTPNVTNLDSVFRQCFKLNNLDLRHFSVSKVTTLTYAFESCYNLKTLDLRGWNTEANTTLNSTFASCYSLENILGLENFITNNVTTLYNTFSGCYSIKKLSVENWNTAKVTNLSGTFGNCRSIKELDLSKWNVNKVTVVSSLFSSCWSLKRLNLQGWQTGTLTGNQAYIFSGCYSLQEVNLSWLHINSSCTNIRSIFDGCWSLKEIHLVNWDTSGLASGNNANSLFNNCYSLKSLTGISNFDFSGIKNSLSSMFSNCYLLEEIDVSNWNITGVTNLSSIFNNCYNLRNLDLSKWDTSSCTTFASLVASCYSLTSIGDISSWDTSNVTNMSNMFISCFSLTNFPNINNWDLSKVTTMDSMFNSCYSLKKVIWTNVNLPKCTNIYSLFRYCYNLKYVDLSNWSVPVATYSTSSYATLGSCRQLETVIGFPIPSSYLNIGFQECENLSYESLMNIINALPSTTAGHIIRIPAASNQLLTTAEKAIATNKNWTIANS